MGQIDWLLIEVSSRKWRYVSQMCFLPTVIKWPELQKSRQVFIYLILFSSTTVWYSTCKWAEEAKSVLISQYFTPSERHTHTSLGDINRLSCSEFALLLSFLWENCLLISWVALNTLYVHNRCSDCSEDAFIYLLPIIATIIYLHKNSLNDPHATFTLLDFCFLAHKPRDTVKNI